MGLRQTKDCAAKEMINGVKKKIAHRIGENSCKLVIQQLISSMHKERRPVNSRNPKYVI